MMEAASTSETSANFYQTTWRNNPEDSHLNTEDSSHVSQAFCTKQPTHKSFYVTNVSFFVTAM
jgi:hypothetical protein